MSNIIYEDFNFNNNDSVNSNDKPIGLIDTIKENINIYLKNKSYCKDNLDLFIDLDDCLLKSSETVLRILQQKFKKYGDAFCNWTMEKCLSELKEWDYGNFILGRMDEKEKLKLFEDDLFWDMIEIDDEFLKMINNNLALYNIYFITKGTEKNLKRKKDLILGMMNSGELKGNVGFIGIKNGKSKSIIDMSNGIQIDDNYSYLETNAKYKILYRNKYCNESDYAGVQVVDGTMNNLYITEFVDEIEQILDFFTKV